MAQSALFYVKDVYDKERFERLRDIAAEMMALKTELPLETVKTLFCSDYGYQTPKVDTRAATFKDGKIGVDYLDLYLIHWPANKKQFNNADEINKATWQAKIDALDNFGGSGLNPDEVDF